MLKINLLPPYIFERRKVKQAAFLFGLLFVATFCGMVTWWYMLGKKEANLKEELAIMKANADQVLAIENTIKAEEGKIPPIKERLEYFAAIREYNGKFPALYEELARYTYERILYRSIQPSNNSLTINAHAKSIGDCGRYLLNMYRARHLFSDVKISAVPGYPNDLAAGFDFTVTCALRTPIDPPPVPASLGGGAAAGGGGGDGTAPVAGPVSAPNATAPSGQEPPPMPQELPPPGMDSGGNPQ